MRWPASVPWQAKQLSERMGRMCSLNEIFSCVPATPAAVAVATAKLKTKMGRSDGTELNMELLSGKQFMVHSDDRDGDMIGVLHRVEPAERNGDETPRELLGAREIFGAVTGRGPGFESTKR